MYNNLQHFFVYLSVFFVALCAIAITQSCAEKHKVTQRIDKIDANPCHYCFSTH
jgi:hypothetical protein